MTRVVLALAVALLALSAVAVVPAAAETDLVDAEVVESLQDHATIETEDEVEADVEADVEDDAEEQADADADAEEESADAAEAGAEADAEAGWPFSKSCDKRKSCAACTKSKRCKFFYNWAKSSRGVRAGYCVQAGGDLDTQLSRTRFPVATADGECAAAFAAGDNAATRKTLGEITRTTTKLDAVAQEVSAAITRLGGKTEFANCPKELWTLYLKQEKLEREFGYKTAPVGGVIDYSVEPFGPLGDVMGKSGDIQDAVQLFAGGFKAADVANVVGGLAAKAIEAGIAAAANRIISVSLLTSEIFATQLGPACDFASCVHNPKLRQQLEFMNWPYGDSAIASITCPVCNHLALPLAALQANDAATHTKLVKAATGLVTVCTKVKANPMSFTPQSPFSTSKPAKAIQSFLTAAQQLVAGGYKTVGGVAGVDKAASDVAEALAVYGVSFVQLKQRLHAARQQQQQH